MDSSITLLALTDRQKERKEGRKVYTMKFKKFTLGLLFVLAFIMCSSSASMSLTMPDKDIIILYTNDVHCGVDDNIGYAGLAFYKSEVGKKTPYVTLIDAGDAVQGAVIGSISNGNYIIEIMNAVGYDLAVPGNHEFDYYMSQFEKFARDLKCGYVSCNFRDVVTGQLVFEPYRIFNYGKTKVAFVGACTPNSIASSNPTAFMDSTGNYIFDFDGEFTGKKFYASIQKAVDEARNNGADYVILVGHLGESIPAPVDIWNAQNVAANTRGIDAVIDGHSHEVTPALFVKNLDGKEIPITQSGTKLKFIGQVTIDTSGKIKTELIGEVKGRDEKITALIDGLKARYEDTLKTQLGYVSFDLIAVDSNNRWLLRNNETNLCDFMADAFFEAAEGEADCAFVNAGNIRADIKTGEITYNNALTVSPFGGTLCICEVPGQTILDELELGVALMPENSGGLLHGSGITYAVDTSVKTPVKLDNKGMLLEISGARRVGNVLIGEKPLDPAQKYKVIAESYVLRGKGDGHVFSGARLLKLDFISTVDAISHYVKKFTSIPENYRNPQGRMKTAPLSE